MEIIKKENQSEILRNSPETFYKEIRVRTFDDVFNSENMAIAAIKKENSEAVARALLVLIVVDVIDFFSIGTPMTDTQIAATVDLILEEFYYLKPDDFKLCFNNAKKSMYGPVYNRIDGSVIFEWLNKYVVERASYAVNKNDSVNAGLKAQELNNTMDDRMKESTIAEETSRIHADYLSKKQKDQKK